MVGRDYELIQLNSCLEKGKHTLILAPKGLGKKTLLHYTRLLAADMDYPHTWIEDGHTARNTLNLLAKSCHESFGLTLPRAVFAQFPPQTQSRFRRQGHIGWPDLSRPLGQRVTTAELGNIIVNSLRQAPLERKFFIFIENLKTTPTVAKFYQQLFQCSCVFAALDTADQYRAHIQPLTYNFMEKIELRPLSIESGREIAESWLLNHELRFTSEQARKAFVQHIARDSGGIPAAIMGMLEDAQTLPEISSSKVRALSHDSAVQYFDMSYVLFGVLVGFMALRYVSRGIGETELMMLSGVGSAVMVGFFYVMRFLRGPGRG